jgi:hypothetical protein
MPIVFFIVSAVLGSLFFLFMAKHTGIVRVHVGTKIPLDSILDRSMHMIFFMDWF